MITKLLSLALSLCQPNNMILKSVGFNQDKNIIITCEHNINKQIFFFYLKDFKVIDIKIKENK